MECPGCGGNIDDSAWICPSCEYILDASFLGPNITNESSRKRLRSVSKRSEALFDEPTEDSLAGQVFASEDRDDPDAPTASLSDNNEMEVSANMIVEEATQDAVPEDPGTDDLVVPALEPVIPQPMDPPDEEDQRDTNVLSADVLPTSGPRALDPALLQEVISVEEPPPLVVQKKKKKGKKGKAKGLPKVKKKTGTDEAEAKKLEVLKRAMARGPIREARGNSVAGKEERAASKARPAPEPEAPKVVVRSPKAEKIFQQALEDIELGNLASARINIKLAITFDPGNERYIEKFEEIAEDAEPAADHLEDVQVGVQFANQYFDRAKEAEANADYDEAIKQLEKAIRADPQGVYYNHLGTILAFHQGKLKEGKKMVEKAVQQSPRNKNYQKNLSKIMSELGYDDGKRNMANMLGGLLNKRK